METNEIIEIVSKDLRFHNALNFLNVVVDYVDPKELWENAEEYVKRKLIASGFKVTDTRRYFLEEPGHPDFYIEFDSLRIYIEVKSQFDGIKLNQFEWALENNQQVVVWFIKSKEVKNGNV